MSLKGFLTVAFQLGKEFWLPLTVATAWTWLWSGKPHSDVAGLVTAFSTSFFFVSWLSGQYFRVSKQVRTESSLGRISKRLEDVVGGLEHATKEVEGWATGGDSWAFVMAAITVGGSNKPNVFAMETKGRYALHSVHLRIVDLAKLAMPDHTQATLAACETSRYFEVLDAGRFHMNVVPLDLPDLPADVEGEFKFNIFFTARNGMWTQFLRVRHVGGVWHTAVRVRREGAPDVPYLLDEVPEGFPQPETLDWG